MLFSAREAVLPPTRRDHLLIEASVDALTVTVRCPTGTTSRTAPGHWARITLCLRERAPKEVFVAYDESFVLDIEALDERAAEYRLSNWESGLISGAGYAFAKARTPCQGILVSELRGALGSQDMEALVLAASIAVLQLLGRDSSIISTNGWTLELTPIKQAGATPLPTSLT